MNLKLNISYVNNKKYKYKSLIKFIKLEGIYANNSILKFNHCRENRRVKKVEYFRVHLYLHTLEIFMFLCRNFALFAKKFLVQYKIIYPRSSDVISSFKKKIKNKNVNFIFICILSKIPSIK